MRSPDASVIVVNFNGRPLLERCLPRVGSACEGLEHELLVVDNGSTDGSAELVASAFPGAVWLALGQNLGYAAAANAGMRAARGRIVVLMNNDVELAAGSVARAVRYLDAHPDAGLVGFRLENPDGSLQPSGRRCPGLLATVLSHWRLVRETYREPGRDYDAIADVDEVSGACLAARASLAAIVGLMDERFFFYYEDVDWCVRVRAAGFRVVYLPEAVAVHAWGATSRGAGWIKAVGRQSMLDYFRKHSGRWASWALKAALVPLDLARLVRARGEEERAVAWQMLRARPRGGA